MKKQTLIALFFAFIIFTAIKAAEDEETNDKSSEKSSEKSPEKTKTLKVFQKEIKGSVLELEWCGTDEIYSDETDRVSVEEGVEDTFDTRVFVLADDGQVYKSSNYGKSWAHVTKEFKNVNSTEPFFATEISISPVDGKTTYVWGKLDTSYVSESCGSRWQRFKHPTGLYDFRFHRKNKNWILAYQEIKCSQFDDDCDPKLKNLYVSEDAGITFTLLSSKAIEASWNRMNNFYSTDSPGIIIAHVDESNGHNVAYTEDFGKNFHVIQVDGDNFYQSDFFLFLTKKPKLNSKSYEMKIATMFDNFNYYVEPQAIKLPFQSKDHISFTILKSEGSQVFLSIHHETEDFKQSNVYVSDWRGYDLNLALLYNVRSANGDCDFEKIESNEGVFIANTYDSDRVEKLRSSTKRMDSGKNKSSTKKNLNEELSQYKKSVISFDNGSNWHSLKAPLKKSNGKSYTCSGDCGLHLVGRTYHKLAQIHSSSNAPGLIIGTGNVGTHLTETYSELNTYLSNDGGHTWNEILKGPHIFEVGDHGGIIVAATVLNRTNIIKYSWDEGKTWNTYKLSVKPFQIESIATEPSNMDQRFLIYGKQKDDESSQTTQITSFDLSGLQVRSCIGAEHPGRPQSDYEVWIPTNFKGDQCIFGRKIKYIRRKPEAQCFNSITTDQKTIVEECPCTFEDWECDFGFYRKDNEGDCIPQSDHYSLENLNKPPKDCGWSYMVSKGYRKIPGIYCDGGVDLSATMKQCPPKIEEPRKEEETQQYLNYKAEQQQIIEKLQKEIQEQYKASLQQQSSMSLYDWFVKISFIFMVLSVLYIGFLFREKIISILFSLFEMLKLKKGDKEYQQLGQYKNSYLPSKNTKSTQQVRIETDDRNYDLEEHEGHYPDEDRPVLQRDQDNYYQEGYD